MAKDPPANAGDTGLIPGWGRFHMVQSNQSHAPQLLSLCSRAWELQLLSPHATTTEGCAPWNLCSTQVRNPHTTTRRAPTCCNWRKSTQVRNPHTATREEPLPTRSSGKPAQQRKPTQPKINQSINKRSYPILRGHMKRCGR